MRALIGLDHPDALLRMQRSFTAGQDTAYIAGFLGIAEAVVVRLIDELREERRAREARMRRLDAAWDGEDVDKSAIAARFGFPSTASARSTLYCWRRRIRPCGSAAA